jgi:hypothetical protein
VPPGEHESYPNYRSFKKGKTSELMARSAGDVIAAFGSDQSKCGHAARLVELSILTQTRPRSST